MNPLWVRRRLNLILGGGVLVLGAWAAWTGLRPHAPLPLISELPVQQVRQIRIDRVGQVSIELGPRADGRWWMEAPTEAPADPERLNTLLRLPAKVSFGAYPLDRARLGELGLDPPLATVVFNGGRVSVGIGRVNPLNHRRYVRVADTVHLVTDSIGDLYAEDPGALVDRHLVPPGVRLLGLELPGLRVHRGALGVWKSEPPAADPELPTRLVRRWLSATALTVEWRPGDRPRGDGEVRFALEGDRVLSLDIVPRAEAVYLVRRELGLNYRMTPAGARRLLRLGDSEAKATGGRPQRPSQGSTPSAAAQ